MLERIVYVSRAAPGIGSGEVYGIIREAHARNAAAGISGALIFMHGRFAQVLEGTAPALRAVWGAILRDPRHADVALRARERALCRLFPGQAHGAPDPRLPRSGPLEAFGYRPGFPVEAFPADVLLEFLVGPAGRPRGRRPRRPGARPPISAARPVMAGD